MKKIRVVKAMTQLEVFQAETANYIAEKCDVTISYAKKLAKSVPVMAIDYTEEKDKFGRHRLIINDTLRCFALGIIAARNTVN